MCPGTTHVSAWVKFWVTCSCTARVATRVKCRVTRLGMTRVSNMGKVLGGDSDKELGIVWDKGPGKCRTS
jgi:hypothetical protein